MADYKEQKQQKRYGEHELIPPRTRRFYSNGSEWFFITRSGKHHGPYAHFTEAETALKLYLRRCGIVRAAS